jgi:hypothetical protein
MFRDRKKPEFIDVGLFTSPSKKVTIIITQGTGSANVAVGTAIRSARYAG